MRAGYKERDHAGGEAQTDGQRTDGGGDKGETGSIGPESDFRVLDENSMPSQTRDRTRDLLCSKQECDTLRNTNY